MTLVLGIDTGGTYTDGVVLDLGNNNLMKKTKTLTTHENLTDCILRCITNLDLTDYQRIKLVSLSTTLATNAIVEGRGCEVGLLLIGHEPIGQLPVNQYAVVQGGHDINGHPLNGLDLPEIRLAVQKMAGKVDAIAISGYLSVRNPEHELQVRDLVKQIIDVPVVCAHQLSTSLGFRERTITAALNAKLIPILAGLIESVKHVLKEKGISAPLMIVKGDGTLMGEAMARERPIDTILSGPAASIIGAAFLTDLSEALILDMGGTTTDIAILKSGVPRIIPEGAAVGGWLTRVQAAEINTVGLGGDSHLTLDKQKHLHFGPQRVVPLAAAAYRFPYLVEEMAAHMANTVSHAQDPGAYLLMKPEAMVNFAGTEREVLEILDSGPHSLMYLAQELGKEHYFINLQPLVNQGILARIGLTPTDILHCMGTYTIWNNQAAKIGAEILASRMGKSQAVFIELAYEAIIDNLCLALIESVLNYEGKKLNLKDNSGVGFFMQKILHHRCWSSKMVKWVGYA